MPDGSAASERIERIVLTEVLGFEKPDGAPAHCRERVRKAALRILDPAT
jgi:hypothetical protein